MGLQDTTLLLSDADQVIVQMTARLKAWAEKARHSDREKIQQRSRELLILKEALNAAKKRLAPIIIDEASNDAYRRGFEAAKRKFSRPDRRSAFEQAFNTPQEREAYRYEHNARQRAKWADHY